MRITDYSERRQSRLAAPSHKRPRVWPYVLLILTLMFLAYGAGLVTGWYLYRPGGKLTKEPQTPQSLQPAAAAKPPTALPPQGQPIAPVPEQSHAKDQPPVDKASGAPPLTFYNTLQKGNKELMGTGINQPKEPAQNPAKPSVPKPPER